MLAAYLKDVKRFEVQEIPTPECGPNEVLIKVTACAICGTDVRIFSYGHRKIKFPWILGHEIAGVVTEVGENVRKKFRYIRAGERVQVVPGIACGRCDNCLRGLMCPNLKAIGYDYPGGFAQYLLVPEEAVFGIGNNLIPIPENLSFAEASLAEPLSCAINGQEVMGGVELGDTVAIVGSGSMGVFHAKLARMQGASRLIMVDVLRKKLELVRQVLGDEGVFYVDASEKDEVKEILDITSGEGADKIIISCSSKSAQERALDFVKMYGKILYFGGLPPGISTINFNSNALHYKLASVHGTFASTVFQQRQALKLIARGFAKGLITHRFPLTKIDKAFETALSGEALKVIIEPWRNE